MFYELQLYLLYLKDSNEHILQVEESSVSLKNGKDKPSISSYKSIQWLNI